MFLIIQCVHIHIFYLVFQTLLKIVEFVDSDPCDQISWLNQTLTDTLENEKENIQKKNMKFVIKLFLFNVENSKNTILTLIITMCYVILFQVERYPVQCEYLWLYRCTQQLMYRLVCTKELRILISSILRKMGLESRQVGSNLI